MIISNVYLTIFAFGMLGCVLSTPLVTWVATRVGRDRPPGPLPADSPGRDPAAGRPGAGDRRGDRRPADLRGRLGGPAGRGRGRRSRGPGLLLARGLVVILVVGFVDDTRSLGPRLKLLGQAAAVLALYFGGVRIRSIEFLSLNFDLDHPAIQLSAGWDCPLDLSVPSLLVTLVWFLGCMNIWNLIDGMDGLASGRGAAGQRDADAGGDPQRELRGRGRWRSALAGQPGGVPAL